MIIAAAIQLGNATVSLPRPARHHDVLRAIREVAPDADMHHPDQQGFLTDDGVFSSPSATCSQQPATAAIAPVAVSPRRWALPLMVMQMQVGAMLSPLSCFLHPCDPAFITTA
jgi:hypothetical protein